ncbi:hypothetical protein [Actinophytocola sediminis]
MTEFIGRARELRTCLDHLYAPDLHGHVIDVAGLNGIGKTMFLDRLAAMADGQARVIRLDMRDHGIGEGYSGEFGLTASSAMLLETLSRSKQILHRYFDDGRREFADFRLVARLDGLEGERQQGYNAITFGDSAKVGNLDARVEINAESANRDALRERQQRINDAFVSAWEAVIRKRREPVLVTIDAFELVADDQIGWWLLRDLVRHLPRTLVVIARTPTVHTWLQDAEFHQLPLTHFTREETADFLRRRCSGVPVSDEITDIVLRFTDGHPGGVGLVAELVLELGGPALDALTLRRTLDRLPAQSHQLWAELVDAILGAARQPRHREAVEAAAVADTFTEGLLGTLIGSGVVAADVIADLARLRMIRQVGEASGRSHNSYRLHEFLRLAIEARTPARNRTRWRELHQLAADHYYASLGDLDSDLREGSYESWYAFEDPLWQHHKRRWLHHSGMLVERRAITRTRFLLVFLKAFWWWGSYVPFEFNRGLLEDWNRTATIWANASENVALVEAELSRDRAFLDALATLLTTYPMGSPKPADAPWDQVRGQLLLLRDLTVRSLAKGVRLTEDEQRDAAFADALLAVYLAHSIRFRSRGDDRATRYYQSATATFERLGDDWNVAWMLSEQAEMAFEAGDHTAAERLLAHSARREHARASDDEDWDHELQGDLHRLRGDLWWRQGELGKAGVCYGRAVRQAYWLHGAWQGGPDEYTSEFYREQTSRVARRVGELTAQARVAEFLAGVRDGCPEACPAVPATLPTEVNEVRAALFVAGPSPADLRSEGSDFMARWRLHWEDCLDVVAGLDELRGTGQPD